jgi:plastocyanin
MRVRASAALGIAALSLAACGGGSDEGAAPSGASIKTIQIGETEYKLAPAAVQVDKPGVYTFHVVNNGHLTHALEVEGNGVEAKTDDLSLGSSADLKVDLTSAGDYEVYCPIDSHKDMGMEARLTVGGGTGSSETSTSGGYSY